MAADPFAELLRQLRRNADRSQDEQADAINAASGRATVTRREVSRYENGENVPTNHTRWRTGCGARPRQGLPAAHPLRRRPAEEDRKGTQRAVGIAATHGRRGLRSSRSH
ncbi:helix-turn-helix domain-containing protein [Streptomyces violaceusniger]|uniref:helix-turn-helix domain-containing protein n=1 Tax=Streptomyces violaceusniger TaxID=68280 RepID=UPI002072C565|nr:helix-turn-helix transcriptional regulator [Streptomyces violaceusniger]